MRMMTTKKLMLLINLQLANFKCNQVLITEITTQSWVQTKLEMQLVRNLILNLRQISSITCRIIKEGLRLAQVSSSRLLRNQILTRNSKFMMAKKKIQMSLMLMAMELLIITMLTSSMMASSLFFKMRTRVPKTLIENQKGNTSRNLTILNGSCRNNHITTSSTTTMRSWMVKMKVISTIFMGFRVCLMKKMLATSLMIKTNS